MTAGTGGRDAERGATTVIVVLCFLLIFSLLAFVIDLGFAKANRRAAQSAADAAALAAAGSLLRNEPDSQVVTEVKQYAETAYGIDDTAWAGCADPAPLAVQPDLTVNGNTCISYDRAQTLARVRIPPVKQASFFAAVVGVGSPNVTASAQATWGDAVNGVNCIFCVLGNYAGGGADLDTNGDVAVNHDVTLAAGGSVTAAPGSIGVAGSAPTSGLSPSATAISHFSDPLAGLTPWPPLGVVAAGMPVTYSGTGACTSGAYYRVSGCTSFESGGVFTIVGPTTMAPTSPGTVTGTNVLFYLTCGDQLGFQLYDVISCSSPARDSVGTFNGTGSGTVDLSGQTLGTFGQFLFVVDRESSARVRLATTFGSTLTGGVYGAGARLDNLGTSGPNGSTINGPVVVGRVALTGSGDLDQVYGPVPVVLNAPALPHLTQ